MRVCGSPMYGCSCERSANVSPSIQLRTTRPCSSNPSQRGAASKRACSRWRSTSRISATRGPGGRRTVSPTRTTPSLSSPPRSRSSDGTEQERARFLRHLACDDEPLDLLRALVDLRDLRVAHEALDGVLLDVAVAAEDLH